MSDSKRARMEAGCTDLVITAMLPASSLSPTVPLSAWWMCSITDTKLISPCLALLKRKALVPELKHLIMIRKRVPADDNESSSAIADVLLCPVDGSEQDKHSLLELLLPHLGDHVTVSEVLVPYTVTPVTRVQYEYARSHWPCRFRPDKVLEAKLADQHYTGEARGLLGEHMSLVRTPNMGRVQCAIKCVMVDLNTNKMLASTSTDDKIALGHACLLAIPAVALQYKQNTPKEPSSPRPYLCQQVHCFVSHELCVMCAGALMLSRVQGVFFEHSLQAPAVGALRPGTAQVHCNEKLNHHFDVFQLKFGKDCDREGDDRPCE